MSMSRRTFLQTAATVPFAAAFPAEAQQRPNLFEVLKQFHFMGEDGKPVSIGALEKVLKNQFVTLSFGFSGCSDICPLSINPNLAAVGSLNKDTVTSIVINVVPEAEGVEPYRSGQSDFLKKQGLPQRTITLFTTDARGSLSNQQSITLQTIFAIVNKDDNRKHSPKIMLFAPGGAFLDEKLATSPAEEFTKDWAAHLASPSKGR